MGVYIKCIEMPTTEQGVRTINIYADGVVTNYAEVTIGKAVPVPPHGDLIDRDALKAAICSRLCIKSEEYLSPAEATIVNEIFAAPTIIQKEEGE